MFLLEGWSERSSTIPWEYWAWNSLKLLELPMSRGKAILRDQYIHRLTIEFWSRPNSSFRFLERVIIILLVQSWFKIYTKDLGLNPKWPLFYSPLICQSNLIYDSKNNLILHATPGGAVKHSVAYKKNVESDTQTTKNFHLAKNEVNIISVCLPLKICEQTSQGVIFL